LIEGASPLFSLNGESTDKTEKRKDMKKMFLAAAVASACLIGLEAAPSDAVTKADLQAIIARLAKLEAENKAQAARIAELEGRNAALAAAALKPAASGGVAGEDGTETNGTGRIYTTGSGRKYLLADRFANIFEPLSESGLQVTPYGYLVFEGVWNSHAVDLDYCTDFVKRHGKGGTTLSVQDSILGIKLATPEAQSGWTFSGKAEFDLAGDHQNDYAFHWRHLYVDAQHESGWSLLFGQTWHLWKMVTPSEIDGAWMENTGHPYRRSPQMRVTKKWDWEESSLEARVGIVKGGPGMGGDRDSDAIQDNTASSWALFQGALLYDRVAPWEEAGRRWLVGIGGMYGRDRAHRWTGDGFGGEDDEYDSKMVMVAGSVPLFSSLTLTGQFFAGDNLGGVQAGCAQRVAYLHAGEKGREVSTVGGFADLRWDLNKTWSFAIGYGFDDPTDSEARHALGILRNDRAYIDAFYKVNDNLSFGLEYARLTTRYGDAGDDNEEDVGDDRVQFSAWYNF
jgi:hypothetical protein